jgi:hypothetical protein
MPETIIPGESHPINANAKNCGPSKQLFAKLLSMFRRKYSPSNTEQNEKAADEIQTSKTPLQNRPVCNTNRNGKTTHKTKNAIN